MIPPELVKLTASDFRLFVRRMWPAVSSDPFIAGYHLDAICEHLQAIADGLISRLCMNVAVRHSKSLLTSVFFPAWSWVQSPERRIITASYSQVLTIRDAVRTRQLLESDLFQSYFGKIQFNDDTNRKDYYANTSNGHRLSVSIGSRTAGFDADLIVADDIHDFATRTSEAERNKAIDYFETALCSRLVYTGKQGIVLAGHRIHDDDVYARLRAKYGDDGSWTWLTLPEEYSPKFSGWYNGIGWKDKRAEGELLWPERFNDKILNDEKKRYRHEYSAIFLQEPTPAEGTLFKADWFRYYTTEEDEHGRYYILDGKKYDQSKAWRFSVCDTAISTNTGADYTVCQVWDVIGPYLVLVDQIRKRLDGSKIVPTLADFVTKHEAQFLSVEREFVGKFVIDQLRERNIICKPFEAKGHGNKETRAVAGEIRMEGLTVFFPNGSSWVAALEKELLAFPNGQHDDQVDCLSMACILAEKYRGKAEVVETPAEAEVRVKREADDKFNRILWAGAPF